MSKYRELKNQLDDVVSQLETDDIAIDEVLILHEKAKKLIAKLEQYLVDVENKITE